MNRTPYVVSYKEWKKSIKVTTKVLTKWVTKDAI